VRERRWRGGGGEGEGLKEQQEEEDLDGNTACTIPFLVVSSHGRTVQLEATHGETILDCKNKLHQKEGIPIVEGIAGG